ncbi:MAG: hypothetical protein PHN57_01095 [Candidatus Omnitrophica bacterium]|nr:hypothetical protein [Candidatus Omnitrophota bacterium]
MKTKAVFKIIGGILLVQGLICFVLSYLAPKYTAGARFNPSFELHMLNLMCFGLINIVLGKSFFDLASAYPSADMTKVMHFKLLTGIFAALWFWEWLSNEKIFETIGPVEYIFYFIIILAVFMHYKQCRANCRKTRSLTGEKQC